MGNVIIELTQVELGIAWVALREFQRNAEAASASADTEIQAFALVELAAATSALQKLTEASY